MKTKKRIFYDYKYFIIEHLNEEDKIVKKEYFSTNFKNEDPIKYKEENFNPLNGCYHRVNKPAIIYYQNSKVYLQFHYLNGKLHNSVGPAIIKTSKYENSVRFFINNVEYKKSKFLEILEDNLNGN